MPKGFMSKKTKNVYIMEIILETLHIFELSSYLIIHMNTSSRQNWVFTSILSQRSVITTRAWEGSPKEHRPKQKWLNSFSYKCTRAIHSFQSFAHPPQSFRCCTWPPSHHPSNLTSVYTIPALHSGHQHPSSHTVLIHSIHVSKPSQCALIHSTHQLTFYSSASKQLFILNSFHSWHHYETSQTLHCQNITFLLSALFMPHVSALYNAIINYTFSHLSQISYCSSHFSLLPMLYTSHLFCVPHPFHIHYPLPLANPGT